MTALMPAKVDCPCPGSTDFEASLLVTGSGIDPAAAIDNLRTMMPSGIDIAEFYKAVGNIPITCTPGKCPQCTKVTSQTCGPTGFFPPAPENVGTPAAPNFQIKWIFTLKVTVVCTCMPASAVPKTTPPDGF